VSPKPADVEIKKKDEKSVKAAPSAPMKKKPAEVETPDQQDTTSEEVQKKENKFAKKPMASAVAKPPVAPP